MDGYRQDSWGRLPAAQASWAIHTAACNTSQPHASHTPSMHPTPHAYLLCLLPKGHHRGWQVLLVCLHPGAVLLHKLPLLHSLGCCCQRLQHVLRPLLA